MTVITREQIEQQADFTRNLADIIAREAPGFGPPNQYRIPRGQNLRGRGVSVLIDGVPQTSNTQTRPLQTIAPSAIERIEILRGPTAIYGAQETGGTINIITRSPSEDRLMSTVEVGVNAAAGGQRFLEGEGFGNFFEVEFSGTENDFFDYVLSFSQEGTGSFFDAEGNRIASDRPLYDSQILNVLTKFGLNLDSNQRLQLTFNHYDNTQRTEFVLDPSVNNLLPGNDQARSNRVGELEFFNTVPPTDRNTFISLGYTHENLFSSQVQSQIYYRNNSIAQPSFDGRGGIFDSVIIGRPKHENWGGRLQFETPFFTNASLLWGVDYDKEENVFIYDILSPDDFDSSDGRVNRRIDSRNLHPLYEINQLGLFTQLRWNLSESLLLSGGVRYADFGIRVPDYTTFFGEPIQGGNLNFSNTVFNLGTVYQFTDEISLFANFSQGFSVPDFLVPLAFPPNGFSVEGGFVEVQPQIVDNYEIGIRGNWNNVQASLSSFYNYSGLGAFFERLSEGGFRVIRSPQRIYGIEATIDWQPRAEWRLGTTVSWQEGEQENNDGDFIALNSLTISPLKLTAYVEHQTTPGWRNRLQFLYVGDRNQGFEAETDPVTIEDYFVMDYIGSIQFGSGTLNIGIENLFDNQYFVVPAQHFGGFSNSERFAARGRTLSINYRITF